MAESDNILTKLNDLLIYVIPQINKFPRDQRFVLGDRIENQLLDVQESCLRAYYSRDKRGHLLEANLRLEVARHLVRLAHGLRLFSNHTYGVLAAKMDEVGRMIGGWLKSLPDADGSHVPSRDRSYHERPQAPQGFGLRQSSGAFPPAAPVQKRQKAAALQDAGASATNLDNQMAKPAG
jgi:hypothetical protein